jgi:hypothetical protein
MENAQFAFQILSFEEYGFGSVAAVYGLVVVNPSLVNEID